MLNIKDNGFGRPKTYKSILNYDKHHYKEDRLVVKSNDKENENVRLVDNVEQFEKLLKQYNKDLFDSFSKERHNKLKKTHKEMVKSYLDSKILRSFRISINHIELDALHSPTDTKEQRKENIVNFYKQTLDTFVKQLESSHPFNQKIEIVQADIHFDQASPHLHVHVSNLYNRFSKKLNRDIISNNIKISDAINSLMTEKMENDIKQPINEIFSQKLKQSVENDPRYSLVNRIDLKALFPHIYDLNKWKIARGYDDINRFWRHDKELYFQMVRQNLKAWGFKDLINEPNDILLSRKIDDISLYCYKQGLYMKATKDLNFSEKSIFELIYSPNKVCNKISELTILEPQNLKKYEDKISKNISYYDEKLYQIEQELINNLELFKQHELAIARIEYEELQAKKAIESNNLEEINNIQEEHHIQMKELENIAYEKQQLAMMQEKYQRLQESKNQVDKELSISKDIDRENTKTINNDISTTINNNLSSNNLDHLFSTKEIDFNNINQQSLKNYQPENNINTYLSNVRDGFDCSNRLDQSIRIENKNDFYMKSKAKTNPSKSLDGLNFSLGGRRNTNYYKAPVINENDFKPKDYWKNMEYFSIDNEEEKKKKKQQEYDNELKL